MGDLHAITNERNLLKQDLNRRMSEDKSKEMLTPLQIYRANLELECALGDMYKKYQAQDKDFSFRKMSTPEQEEEQRLIDQRYKSSMERINGYEFILRMTRKMNISFPVPSNDHAPDWDESLGMILNKAEPLDDFPEVDEWIDILLEDETSSPTVTAQKKEDKDPGKPPKKGTPEHLHQ